MQLGTTPPFELGQYMTGTDADGNLINTMHEGEMYVLPDNRQTGNIRGSKARRSNRQLIGVVCRNTSGITLYGKRIGIMERDTSNPTDFLGRVNGYSAVLRQDGIIAIDDQLSSSGVPDKALFWGIKYGLQSMLTANAGADFPEDIAAHSRLIAGTAAGTTTSLAGRIASVTLSTATQALNTPILGWALTAKTTQATGTEVFVFLTLGFRD